MLIAQISTFMSGRRARPASARSTATPCSRARSGDPGPDPRPDAVIASGDLTDCGLDEEYAVLDEILSRLSMPVFVVPGNHNRRERLRGTMGRSHGYLPQDGFLQFVMEPPGLVLHLWREGTMASHVLPIGDFGKAAPAAA